MRRRLFPDNKHSVFNVLRDAAEYNFVETSGNNPFCISYPLFTYWLCGVKLVFIHKAEAVKDLLKEKRIIEKSTFYDFLKPYFGTSVFTCDSSKWKERRKLLSAGFHISMLKGYVNVFNEHAQKLVEFLHEETGKKNSHALKPSYLCIFGVKIGALQSEAEEYVSSLHRLSDLAMSRIWKVWQWPEFIFHFSKAYREFLQHLRIAHGFSRRKWETTAEDPKCLLDVLLKLHIEDQVLDEEGVRQEVDTFISAGHETVAVAVKWALYLIGLYPEVQEKLHQELDSLLGVGSKGPLSVAELNEMKYLECVLKECNRIYPPVPIIARNITEETGISFFRWLHSTKRTQVIVSPLLVHRDEDVFPDPEKFDPERFLPENSAHIPECAYIPFAAGPRGCIGRVFAEMEVKILVCHILRNFSLHSLDSRDLVLPLIKITLQSSQSARIKFRRRQ
ncbi:cytochrome P450 4c3 [Caerostris extrusa]|uniref:Cytochrome P450 4c3 n=1 Tax=Caerostris extrusa TaxID=172846 RepID=A0AAV4QGE0_CAEEX|nr:cytochrome P450 4c3 [Caerostris extrusa]